MSILLRSGILILVIITIFTWVTGCTLPGSASQTSSALPADKYVALYEEYNEEGMTLDRKGTVFSWSGPALEPFDYDGSKGYSSQYSRITGDFQIYQGIYYYYASPASGHTTACYSGFNGPYPLHILSNLTIHGIDEYGTINASYGDQPVILKPGDSWESPVETRIVDKIFVIDEKSMAGTLVPVEPVRYNSTWTVENKGAFNKSNLRK